MLSIKMEANQFLKFLENEFYERIFDNEVRQILEKGLTNFQDLNFQDLLDLTCIIQTLGLQDKFKEQIGNETLTNALTNSISTNEYFVDYISTFTFRYFLPALLKQVNKPEKKRITKLNTKMGNKFKICGHHLDSCSFLRVFYYSDSELKFKDILATTKYVYYEYEDDQLEMYYPFKVMRQITIGTGAKSINILDCIKKNSLELMSIRLKSLNIDIKTYEKIYDDVKRDVGITCHVGKATSINEAKHLLVTASTISEEFYYYMCNIIFQSAIRQWFQY